MNPRIHTAAAAAFFAVLCSNCTCEPPKKCGPNSCIGCCDVQGTCQPGTLPTACGTAGAQCATCTKSCVSGTCLGDQGGDGGGGGGPAFDAFYQEYADIWCSWFIACKRLEAATKADCVTYVIRYSGAFKASVVKGYQSYDAARAAACLASVRAASASCNDLTVDDLRDCSRILEPASGPGQGCLVSDDCKYPMACGGTGCAKTCQPGGGLNQPCPYSRCNTGFWCDRTANLCRAPQGPGGACTPYYSYQCDTTTYCDAATRRCTALPVDGQTCLTSSPYCHPDTYCAYTAGPDTCRKRLAVGAPCGFATNACVQTAFCDTSLNPAACALKRGTGGSCFSSSQCQTGLDCRSSVCTSPIGEGGACTPSSPSYVDNCAPPFACDKVSRTCQGYRYDVPTGGTCTGSTLNCQFYDSCKGASTNPDGGVGVMGVCSPMAVGDACRQYSPSCPIEAYCLRAGDGGTCAKAAAGTPCNDSSQCLVVHYCGDGKTCSPRIASGQPCQLSFPDSCVPPDSCRIATAGATTGTCSELGGAGAPCLSNSGGGCKMEYLCSAGSCVAAGRMGQPCLEYLGCFAGACQGRDGGYSGTCGALRADGELCSILNNECASNYCDNGRCAPACT